MAGGPQGTWTTTTDQAIPTQWSVSTGKNIRWKTELPEGGQSGIAIWGDRLFLSINKPLPLNTPLEKAEGSDIVGYCLDANTGKLIWTVEIPSPKTMPYSGLFSDNTSATPITDGKRVWFINQGGSMACFTMEGKLVWTRPFESRTRHNAKQCEPILVDDQLLFVLMRDPNDPLRREMKAKSGNRESPAKDWPWTFIRSFDANTGKPLWTEPTGTSVHNTPRLGYLDGEPYVFHGRGGGHVPPEMPYGFSMSKVGGENLWNYESKGTVTYTVAHFDSQHAYGFDRGSLMKFDARNGTVVAKFP
ncbi:MAG: PQQ-binding-like beta-propeller repeat protein, partial [Verrucomicrobiae bacterium]|nr:PQQ-binding-like beta-propeller repeat protein [Verrucomicrobiae bacterium]